MVEEQLELPTTESQWTDIAAGWRTKDVTSTTKNIDTLPGTIFAGDGLVIQMNAVRVKDLGGLDLARFRNRKGFFGVIAQGFCDADAYFHSFELKWPGATPDIVAYKQSALYSIIQQGVS